jgi:transcriptional regulator with XRE-family HTH domain
MKRDKFIAIRMYLEMTVPEFAQYFDISPSNIYMIESGERRITKRVIGKIAKKFEETPGFLAYYSRTKKLSE